MKRLREISTFVLAAFLILMVIGANLVQYHHHDEHCRVCLCLDPLSHCHDDDHHDCNHQEDGDCAIHVEDSIVVDKFDLDCHALFMPLALMFWDKPDLGADVVHQSYYALTQPPLCQSGFVDCLNLRAPPVL